MPHWMFVCNHGNSRVQAAAASFGMVEYGCGFGFTTLKLNGVVVHLMVTPR